MSRRSLRPQLNQIRAWVREGRTDAWIAHQLEVSASELREFRRQHDLSPDSDADSGADIDLRDEIEAEIEAAAAEEEALERERAEKEAEEAAAREAAGESDDVEEDEDESDEESDGSEAEGRPRRRRRRGRRGGARQERSSNELEGTFDHGEEGYGLWLDPAVQDIAAYRDNWAGRRDVTVTVEEDQIVIRRND
jgi:hypothetical protein